MNPQFSSDSNNPRNKKFDKIYILDTNIILNDARNIFNIADGGNNLVVIPETTMDEVDVKKSGWNEENYQAKEFGRIISNSDVLGLERFEDMTIITYSLSNDNSITFCTISKEHYNIDTDGHPDIINDRRILTIAKECLNIYGENVNVIENLDNFNENIVFLSLDNMCRGRAYSLGIKAEPLTQNGYENTPLEYIKELNVSNEDIDILSGQEIIDIDPNYKIENYSYHFKSNNGNRLLAVIENGIIRQVEEVALRSKEIIPQNSEQLFAMDAIINRHYNIILMDALAGSGKTLISVFSAMQLVRDKNNPYNKITYIRNSIESVDKGEDIGYLKGEKDEKNKIYTLPLYDTLSMIARAKYKKEKDKDDLDVETELEIVQGYFDRYSIETPWIGEIRGRTISNSVVIIDEGQNMSKKSMQTVVSRLDKNCILIVIGSNKQIDNIYVNKYTNGLSSIIKASRSKDEKIRIFATKLTKVVRGPITEWAEKIFDN